MPGNGAARAGPALQRLCLGPVRPGRVGQHRTQGSRPPLVAVFREEEPGPTGPHPRRQVRLRPARPGLPRLAPRPPWVTRAEAARSPPRCLLRVSSPFRAPARNRRAFGREGDRVWESGCGRRSGVRPRPCALPAGPPAEGRDWRGGRCHLRWRPGQHPDPSHLVSTGSSGGRSLVNHLQRKPPNYACLDAAL